MTSTATQIQIKIAETEAEREAAYRLRYVVFGLEGGDHRYSDHDRKFWIDQDDGPNSTLLIALDQVGSCIGTTRFTLLRNQSFIGLEAYHLGVLAYRLNLTLEELYKIVGRWDRGVVSKFARGKGILQHMEYHVAKIACAQGSHVIVGTIREENLSIFRAVNKCGYQTYPAIGSHGGFTGQLIYKDLRANLLVPDETTHKTS